MAHISVRPARTPISTLVLRAVLTLVAVRLVLLASFHAPTVGWATLGGAIAGNLTAFALLSTPEVRAALNGLAPKTARVICYLFPLVADCTLIAIGWALTHTWAMDLMVLILQVVLGAAVTRLWASVRAQALAHVTIAIIAAALNVSGILTGTSDVLSATVVTGFIAAIAGMNIASAYALAHHLAAATDLTGYVASERRKANAERKFERWLTERREHNRHNIAVRRAINAARA